MTSDKLITVLEKIRDQQKLQIVNFEQAMQTQGEAQAIQQRGRRMLIFLIAAPWVLVVSMLIALLLRTW